MQWGSMNYGELPATGLYVVLSIVVVLAAILTTQIADVRKRKGTDWKKDAVRLRRFATGLMWIAKVGAAQIMVVLLVAAWKAYGRRLDGDAWGAWWSTVHTAVHLLVVFALFVFLVRWFRSMERNPKSPY